MACACSKRNRNTYVWTSSDGVTTSTHNTEIEAKAKVMRKGGSYKTVPKA